MRRGVARGLCLLVLVLLWLRLLLLLWPGVTVLLRSCSCGGRARRCAVERLPVVDGRVVVACCQLLGPEALRPADGHAV